MASGAPNAAALARARKRGRAAAGAEQPAGYNADQRTAERENAPVVIAGVTFTRHRKDWGVSRIMRGLIRVQETAIAKGTRLRTRIAELETEQIEAATTGDDATEADLEAKIQELVKTADESTEDAELVTYRLIALLLNAPAPAKDAEPLQGFGPDYADVDDVNPAVPAIEFLQPALDVEDAAALARELTGSDDGGPDPQTPSSEAGSS